MSSTTSSLPALEYPDTALPIVAEERLLSGCLGDPGTIYRIRDDPALQLDWSHFSGAQTRQIAKAIWTLANPAAAPDGKPRTVEIGSVILELQRAGVYDTEVRPEYLRRLDHAGTTIVVRAAPEYARMVRDAAIARQLALSGWSFTNAILHDPAGARGYAAAHVEQVTRSVAAGAQTVDHSVQRHADEDGMDAPGIFTGIPFFDITSMGCCEAEMIGWQGVFKDGKTRSLIMSLLRILVAGEPVVFLTTDNRAKMLRHRLAVLLATAAMQRAKVDPLEMTLDPKRLNPRNLSDVQQRFLRQARQQIDDSMKLWILDATDGIQDFTRGMEWLDRYMRPPYNCRIWVWDHIADLSVHGKQDWDAFKLIINTLKTRNQEWGTTGIPVNQKKEAGDGVRSHMGGAFPQALDYLYEPHTSTIWQKDQDTGEERPTTVVDVNLTVARWTEPIAHRFIINPSSGLFLNGFSVPDALKLDLARLPYVMERRGQWNVQVDGDPYRH